LPTITEAQNEEKILLGQLLPKIQTKIKALPCKKWPGITDELESLPYKFSKIMIVFLIN
jgi:hypothetical protein